MKAPILVSICLVATLTVACAGTSEPSALGLGDLVGLCGIQHFELLSTVAPVTVLYDGVANAYQGSLSITANAGGSSGTYNFLVGHQDNLHLNGDASGSLLFVVPDTLVLGTAPSFPSKTQVSLVGRIVTLTSLQARSVALPGGTTTVTTRLTCQLP